MARPQDAFGKHAKKEGYPARSVFKLQEIDQRVRLLRPGMRVLDLGAFPGSWTLYASKQLGLSGRVVAIDIQRRETGLPPNAEYRQADIFEIDIAELKAYSRFDLVISDMAPNTSGNRDRDQYLSYELYMRALEIAREVLVPQGNFVGKIFQGPDFQNARQTTSSCFDKVRIMKPRASRRESYEVFLVGLGFIRNRRP
ncbi:MAG: RlmE family RNA methyltransferase [Deltaproteobacteria bacterium]|nr:RlmE family RNA methyltransferase [Deltaproteobacteria bacterium]